jgi:prepilin-type N-terminal cleavage/methylation domain-containing protein
VFLQPFMSWPNGRRSSRGFTLIELMAVVLIIAIMATLASPFITEQMRERRSRETAQQLAQLFTSGRMRALGRGAGVLVRYRTASGFTVLESIEGSASAIARTGSATCAAQPGLGCLANNWTNPSLSRQVALYNPPATVTVTMRDPSGTAQTQMDVCFTPLGRSFISFDGNPPTAPMVGAATIDVKRNAGVGLLRTVAILPTGMARVGL